MIIKANLIDIHKKEIYPAEISVDNGIIQGIVHSKHKYRRYILPGLIDSHLHIESSLSTPGAFALAAVSRGTTGVICDPHEIANVLGMEGIRFMLNDAQRVPLKFWFGAPSCVPATKYETTGSEISPEDIETLMGMDEIKYMAEMMNFPGVINNDPGVHAKLKIAHKYGKPVDGHAPGLTGDGLEKYINMGISTDHECSTVEEALEKISLGMKILIREGSAARNLDALKTLFNTHPEKVMLCSDDLHPEMLEKGHIDRIIRKLLKEGYDLFDVIRACTLNPCRHYDLEAGLLQQGDRADFILVDDYSEMNILETWIEGVKVYDRGKVLFNYAGNKPVNKFICSEITIEMIEIQRKGSKMLVIEAFDGELLTGKLSVDNVKGHIINPDINSDILKIVVKDRYTNRIPATGFIKGFGLKRGAFASSVAHDSHNIISIGTNDKDIVNAINKIVEMKGGLAVSDGEFSSFLPLPVAGIMSDKPVHVTAGIYEKLSENVRSLGCGLSAPFMTLSFMALLVIPELKLSDRGLFDGKQFCNVDLFYD